MRLFAVLCFAACAGTISCYTVCKTNTDCSADECCVPEMRFHIVSRRQLTDKSVNWMSTDAGRCVAYLKENASCHYLGFASCGCSPGLKCNYYPAPDVLRPVGKRDMMFKPGQSFCEKP